MDIGGIIILSVAYTGVTAIAAALKSHTSFIGKKPKNTSIFIVENNINDTKNAVIQFAHSNNYNMVHFDEPQGHIILEKKPNWWRDMYGYYLIIYLSKQTDTSTKIEIGGTSKSFAAFFGAYDLNRSLKQFPTEIQSQLSLIKQDKKTGVIPNIDNNENKKFCTNCGKLLQVDTKFCTGCGNPTA